MFLRLLLVSMPLYLLDQLTKWMVLEYIPEYAPIHVVPGFFNLVRTYNTGMAFGLMKDNNSFFIGLSFFALGVLALMQWRGTFQGWLPQTAFLLLVAGICGNLTDRIFHGHVIDFLEFYFEAGGRAWVWPAFNVADSCICVSAALFILGSFTSARPKPARENDARLNSNANLEP